jgi:hypothetical protein
VKKDKYLNTEEFIDKVRTTFDEVWSKRESL